MKINDEKIGKLISQIEEIIDRLKEAEQKFETHIDEVHPDYRRSAQNLVHYSAFRKSDKKSIQRKLNSLGLTDMSHNEEHIMSSLIQVRSILYNLIDQVDFVPIKSELSIKKGRKLLKKNDVNLFGQATNNRRVNIMVTQPTESAYNYELVHEMIVSGMDCARINCAHDNPEVWRKIIDNIQKASEDLDKDVKIAMDLAGPKIRTGKIRQEAKVRKFRPTRDDYGNVVSLSKVKLKKQIEGQQDPDTILVGDVDFTKIKEGGKLLYYDTRGKFRSISVSKVTEEEIIIGSKKTFYVKSGTSFVLKGKKGVEIQIHKVSVKDPHILLKSGDSLIITKENILGESAILGDDGELVKPAHVSCQLPEIFNNIEEGKKILFDDGKIEGVIDKVHNDSFEVKITRASENGMKLKTEKGINFPDSNLGISGLTEKDKKDLEFVAQHADIVNFSFVNSKKDVQELFVELEKLGVMNTLDIVLKIETKTAHDSLKDILLEAMKVKNIGVMIARGDLAIEAGWELIGKVQEGILSICSAAHIPVIWATQVLENLAKTGLPSRSEITDAITSLQAECVMLNKGPFINEAIKLLDTVLSDMERYHDKNQNMLPRIEKVMKK